MYFRPYLEVDLTIAPERAQEVATIAVTHFNAIVSQFRKLFLVDDIIDSIKFGFVLWFLTYIGAWFNGMTLVILCMFKRLFIFPFIIHAPQMILINNKFSFILAFIALFTLPKVYENNKQSIDAQLDLVSSKIQEITEK